MVIFGARASFDSAAAYPFLPSATTCIRAGCW